MFSLNVNLSVVSRPSANAVKRVPPGNSLREIELCKEFFVFQERLEQRGRRRHRVKGALEVRAEPFRSLKFSKGGSFVPRYVLKEAGRYVCSDMVRRVRHRLAGGRESLP